MLMMGRHSSEVLKVDINALLEEYARLAYHSARATDPEFQLDVQYDLDPQMGELEVIPQDLGRVFLNMVANACDATDDKRRAGAGDGEGGNPYVPTLQISSERSAERAVIRIEDNADGMPPAVVAKIFTPAGKGTGLGRSSPPSRPARAPASAWRCPPTSCASTAAPFRSTPSPANSPRW